MSKQLKRPQVIQNHLYPADCLTLTAMMKAVVTGFVDQDGFVNGESIIKPYFLDSASDHMCQNM